MNRRVPRITPVSSIHDARNVSATRVTLEQRPRGRCGRADPAARAVAVRPLPFYLA